MAIKFKGNDFFKDFHYDDNAFDICKKDLGIESIVVEQEVMHVFFIPVSSPTRKGYFVTASLLLDSGSPVTFSDLPNNVGHITYTRNGETYNLYVQGNNDNKMNYTFAPECD